MEPGKLAEDETMVCRWLQLPCTKRDIFKCPFWYTVIASQKGHYVLSQRVSLEINVLLSKPIGVKFFPTRCFLKVVFSFTTCCEKHKSRRIWHCVLPNCRSHGLLVVGCWFTVCKLIIYCRKPTILAHILGHMSIWYNIYTRISPTLSEKYRHYTDTKISEFENGCHVHMCKRLTIGESTFNFKLILL